MSVTKNVSHAVAYKCLFFPRDFQVHQDLQDHK